MCTAPGFQSLLEFIDAAVTIIIVAGIMLRKKLLLNDQLVACAQSYSLRRTPDMGCARDVLKSRDGRKGEKPLCKTANCMEEENKVNWFLHLCSASRSVFSLHPSGRTFGSCNSC